MTDLLKKLSKMEKTINVFNSTIMQGKIGVVRNIQIPSLQGNTSHVCSYVFTCVHIFHQVPILCSKIVFMYVHVCFLFTCIHVYFSFLCIYRESHK